MLASSMVMFLLKEKFSVWRSHDGFSGHFFWASAKLQNN
jgi:hypothetical protein